MGAAHPHPHTTLLRGGSGCHRPSLTRCQPLSPCPCMFPSPPPLPPFLPFLPADNAPDAPPRALAANARACEALLALPFPAFLASVAHSAPCKGFLDSFLAGRSRAHDATQGSSSGSDSGGGCSEVRRVSIVSSGRLPRVWPPLAPSPPPHRVPWRGREHSATVCGRRWRSWTGWCYWCCSG